MKLISYSFKWVAVCLGALGLNQNVYANHVEVIGENPISIRQNMQQALNQGEMIQKLKIIQLMKVRLDKAEQTYLNKESKKLTSSLDDLNRSTKN